MEHSKKRGNISQQYDWFPESAKEIKKNVKEKLFSHLWFYHGKYGRKLNIIKFSWKLMHL